MTDLAELIQRIEQAIVFLGPKFGVSQEELQGFRKPTVEICDRFDESGNLVFLGQYNFETNTIQLSSNYFNDSVAIGEEVSHYIHHQINPARVEKMRKKSLVHDGKVWFAVILGEVVGRYGSILYSVSQGEEFKPHPSPLYYSYGQTAMCFEDLLCHEVGYKRAERAYEMYGESLLPQLARMTVDESMEMLPRLVPVTWYERKVLPLFDKMRRCK